MMFRKVSRVLFLAALICQVVSAGSSLKPVAISTIGRDIVAVLGEDGSVEIIAHGSVQRRGILAPTKKVGDIAVCGEGSDPQIFLTAIRTGGLGSGWQLSPLLQFSLSDFRLRRTWNTPNSLPLAVACGSDGRIYVTTAPGMQIFTARLGEDRLMYLASISTAEQAGPIAVDQVTDDLFVADPFSGAIYLVNGRTKAVRRIVSNLGVPSACAYDPAKKRLYIADSSKHCVWMVSNPSKLGNATPSLFVDSSQLGEPKAVAVQLGGTVWIGDSKRKRVVSYSPEGTLIKKFE